MRRSEANEETARALEGVDPRMAQDFDVMGEATSLRDDAGELAEKIRRRYAEGLGEN